MIRFGYSNEDIKDEEEVSDVPEGKERTELLDHLST
jgi:hypothetical protein